MRRHAWTDLCKSMKAHALSMDDAVTLVRWAAEPFPDGTSPSDHPSAMPLHAAREIAKDGDPTPLLPEIERCFPRLAPGARGAALQILTMAATPDAARLYVKLLRATDGQIDGPSTEFSPEWSPDLAA